MTGRRQLRSGGRNHAARVIAHGHVHIEVGLELLQAPGQARRIAEVLGHERGHVPDDPHGDFVHEVAAGPDGEDDHRDQADDDEDAERVQVDPRVEAGHVSRRPGRARSPRRGPS